MKKIILLNAILLITLGSIAQSLVTGYVYEDENGNGRKEKREKGVPGVAVSNGQDVILTNEKGQYELPLTNDNPIFVIKPSGYQTAVNENNQPQFYYLHKPDGSPTLKYKGVDPSGELPRSIDFALQPSEENETFRALVFGDPQPYTLQEVDFFARGIVKEVERVKDVSFGLSLGDLVGNNLDLFNPYIKSLEKVGIPWYNVMGNHDMNFDVTVDSLSDETYEAHFGPANYAFNYGKVHFIVLDDILYPDPRGLSKYWGGFRKDQLDFVENDLKYVPKDYLVVLAFHIPISEVDDRDLFCDEDRQKLFDLLERFPNTLSLSAHTHIQRQDFFTQADGWKQEKPHHHYNVGTTSGDWYSGRLNENGIPVSTMRDGTPKGYSFITFNGNKYQVNYKVAGSDDNYQMKILVPKVLVQNKKTKARIVVNFFMGSKNDKVEYRIDGGTWKEMERVETIDPVYTFDVLNWDFSNELIEGKRPSNPIDCKHLWTAPLLTKLPEGEHVVEVKATDMFGQTFIQKESYRISAIDK